MDTSAPQRRWRRWLITYLVACYAFWPMALLFGFVLRYLLPTSLRQNPVEEAWPVWQRLPQYLALVAGSPIAVPLMLTVGSLGCLLWDWPPTGRQFAIVGSMWIVFLVSLAASRLSLRLVARLRRRGRSSNGSAAKGGR